MAPSAAAGGKKKKSKGSKVGIDFKKVKHKVGRKLPPPQNATKVEFKSKAIVLPGQSVAQDKNGLAVNQRNKTLKELLNHSTHYSERMRKDALLGMKDLFVRHPKELETNAISTIQKLCARFTDIDKSVRHALLLLLRAVFPNISKAVMKPLIPIVMAHLGSAMTHMTNDLRLSAFSFLDLLLQHYPSLLVPSFMSQIIQYHEHFLGNGGSHGLDTITMLTVLSSLAHFLSVLRLSSSSRPPNTTGLTHRWSQKYDIQKTMQGQEELKALHAYKSSVPETVSAYHAIEAFVSTKNSIDFGGSDGKWMTVASSLIQVLLNCWAECVPAVCSSPLPDALSLDCMVCITKSLCLLFEWLESPFEASGYYELRIELRRRFLSSFSSRLMAPFPIRAPLIQTPPKVVECLGALNAGICEVMLHFFVPDTLENDHFAVNIILQYYECALLGKLLPSSGFNTQIKATEPHVKSLISFIPSVFECAGMDWKYNLLQTLTKAFDTSNPQSNIKLACLSAISKILLSESHDRGKADSTIKYITEQFSKRWLQSFPRLLWELKHNHPSSSKTILEMMLCLGKFAVVDSALATEYEMLQPAMMPFFCTLLPTKQGQGFLRTAKHLYGPFVKLPKECQEIAVDVLYYFSSFQAPFLKAISACCLCPDMDAEVVVRLLELLQFSYSKGHIGVATYLSFLLTLLAGNAPMQDPETAEEIKQRQSVIVGILCRSLSQVGDGGVVLQLLGEPMSEHLVNRSSPELLSRFLRVIAALLSQAYRKDRDLELPISLQNVLPQQAAHAMVSQLLTKDQVAGVILRYSIVLLYRSKPFGKSLMKALSSMLLSDESASAVKGWQRVYAVGMVTLEICKQDGIAQCLAYSDVSEILNAVKGILREASSKQNVLKQLFHLETAIRAAFGSQVSNCLST